MKQVGLVAATFAAALALSSKKGKEYFEKHLQPLYLPTEQQSTEDVDFADAFLRPSRPTLLETFAAHSAVTHRVISHRGSCIHPTVSAYP